MNKQAIMQRAWAIFRETYRYPAISFRSIGRDCFAWALKESWHEAREAARIAAIPAAAKAARIAQLSRALELVPYIENYRQSVDRRTAIEAELASLAA